MYISKVKWNLDHVLRMEARNKCDLFGVNYIMTPIRDFLYRGFVANNGYGKTNDQSKFT